MQYKLNIKKEGISLFPYAKEFLNNLKGIIYYGRVNENYSCFEFKGNHMPYVTTIFYGTKMADKIVITPQGDIFAIVAEFNNDKIVYKKKIDIGRFNVTENEIIFNLNIVLDHSAESVNWPSMGINDIDTVIIYLTNNYAKYYETLQLIVTSIVRVIQYIFDKEFDVVINTYENFDVSNPQHIGINNVLDMHKISKKLVELFEEIFKIKKEKSERLYEEKI